MPRAVAGERVAAEYGFVIRDADGEAERPVSSTPAIAAVMRGSGAEKAGLEVGDVLLTVDDHPVVTRDAAREALADVLPERPLRLMIRRGPRQISLILAPR
jgi:S1-C subfamily serine protease